MKTILILLALFLSGCSTSKATKELQQLCSEGATHGPNGIEYHDPICLTLAGITR